MVLEITYSGDVVVNIPRVLDIANRIKKDISRRGFNFILVNCFDSPVCMHVNEYCTRSMTNP